MTSQLLVRLDQELRRISVPLRRAEILAKKASYLARIGKFEDARTIVAELRVEFGDGRSGHVTALIMLTEGLLHLFEDLSPAALDRVTRSQVLGLAMKDQFVIALASAWKAHIEFETSNFESMVKSLRLAIEHSQANYHDVHARVAMVLSDSFLICGHRQSAQEWFLHSRDHALKEGDQASIEALLYNRAAFSLARIRAKRCLTNLERDELSMARLEIASARNLQTLTGVAALTNFIYLCDARLMILEDRYSESIEALEQIRNQRPFADYNFNQSFVDLEIAFCLMRLRRHDESLSKYALIDWSCFESLDVDEQLVAAWMRYSMCIESPEFGDIADAKLRLDELATKYEEMRLQLLGQLRPFERAENAL